MSTNATATTMRLTKATRAAILYDYKKHLLSRLEVVLDNSILEVSMYDRTGWLYIHKEDTPNEVLQVVSNGNNLKVSFNNMPASLKASLNHDMSNILYRYLHESGTFGVLETIPTNLRAAISISSSGYLPTNVDIHGIARLELPVFSRNFGIVDTPYLNEIMENYPRSRAYFCSFTPNPCMPSLAAASLPPEISLDVDQLLLSYVARFAEINEVASAIEEAYRQSVYPQLQKMTTILEAVSSVNKLIEACPAIAEFIPEALRNPSIDL